MKRWIDMAEEDIEERSRATEYREYGGLKEESGKGTGQPPLAGKICQDNKWMMMHS